MKKQINIYEKLSFLMLMLGMIFSFQACSEEEPGEGILPPTLATQSALDIARTSVRVKGEIEGNTNMIKECGVKYSTSKEFPADRTGKVVLPEVPTSRNVELVLTGLTPNEQYYYCWYATTGATEVCSNTGEFTTAATQKPTFSEFVCDSIGENFARFTCQIEEVGDNYLMEYGVSYKQPSEKTYIPVAAESIDESLMKYTVEIRGLKALTDYMVRAYAKNSEDESGDSGMMEGYSEVLQITTLNQLSPQVTTYDVTTVGITTFTVSGVVTAATGSNGVITECGFCWSEHENPSIADNKYVVDNKELGKDFSYEVTGLLPVSEYYVCAYAKNTVDGEERVGYGDVRMVTTKELITPQLELNNMESGTGSFIATATIQNYDAGALVEKGFIWDKMDSEITYEKAVQNGTFMKVEDGAKLFKGTISGLEMNTHYNIRAYAIYEGSGVQAIGYSWSWGGDTRGVSFYNLQAQTSGNSVTVSSGVRDIDALVGMEVVEKGFCWRMMNNSGDWYAPSLNEGECTGYQAVTDGSLESFSAILTGLEFATSYTIRPYIKVKQGEETVVMYSDGVHSVEAQGFNYSLGTEERTENSITKSFTITNLSEIPADVVIEEVGFFWIEKADNIGNINDVFTELPAENKAIGILDGNGKFTATATSLKEGVKYWIGFYVKFNGKLKFWGWWEDATATVPKVEDNQSPDKI